MADRFDKFTERARKVLQLAQEEAQRFNHNYIGTEHLLLGLVREGKGVAAKVLANLGVELNKVRSAVEFIIGRGDRTVTGDIGLTPRAKKVIELSVDEARRLNHHYIGTEHLLLGLVREGEGIGAGVLESLDITLDKVRSQVIYVLGQGGQSYLQQGSPGGQPLQTGEVEGQPSGRQTAARFDRFSAGAQRVLHLAEEEAVASGRFPIGVEHLVLGLLSEPDSVAAKALGEVGVDVDRARAALESGLDRPGPAELALDEGVKAAIGQAVDHARRLGQSYVGTEHLLLGLLTTAEGAGLTERLGVSREALRGAVERRL